MKSSKFSKIGLVFLIVTVLQAVATLFVGGNSPLVAGGVVAITLWTSAILSQVVIWIWLSVDLAINSSRGPQERVGGLTYVSIFLVNVLIFLFLTTFLFAK